MTFEILKDPFDPDFALYDLDSENDSREIRAMANLSIGVGIDDSYYSVRELLQAVEDSSQDPLHGSIRLGEILSTKCNDYQRAIFYCCAGRGLEKMIRTLKKFEEVLFARGQTAKFMIENGKTVKKVEDPYISDAPFGPVCTTDFDVVLD